MTDGPTLLKHVPVADAADSSLTIDATAQAPHRVNPLLYGKFCEHLGSNIYQGMDAQILRNPTFGAWPFHGEGQRPDGGYSPLYDAEQARRRIEHAGPRLVSADPEALVEAYENGCAFYWFRVGAAERVRFSPDVAPNGCRAQRVEVTAEDGAGPAGIAQSTYLPMHRTRRFPFRVLARAYPAVQVGLAIFPAGDENGSPLCRAPLAIGEDWTVIEGCLEVPADAAPDGLYSVAITAEGDANLVLASVLLHPDDHVGGADPDVIRRLKEARLPLLRWPGGNFVSGYHWRPGVGPIDTRPTVRNRAWACLECNLFGTDEFVALCREVGCEPMICLNAGDGTPEEAADWVEYCNGAADSPMGRLRAENGHPEPYAVRYWEVGNEIYGKWQVNWTTPAGNVDRYLRFARAVRAVDPTVRVLACGGWPDRDWDRALIAGAAPELTCITHHPLVGGAVDDSIDPVDLYHAFMAYPAGMVAAYRASCDEMRRAGIAEPRVAVTELQIFAHYRPAERKPGERRPAPIATSDSIAEALYDALMIHELIRAGECIEMLTHSATVNHGGGLRKTQERVWPNPAHYGHVLGVELAGGTPVAVRLTCPTLSGDRPMGDLPAPRDTPVLDAMAALSADGDALLVMLVNRSAVHGTVPLRIELSGFEPAGRAEVVSLVGDALNDRNSHDDPEHISPRTADLVIEDPHLELELPPFSLTRLRIPRA